MAIDKKTYAASKKYTDIEVAGGGAIKGKNCTIDDISPITGGNRVTFKWTLDNGTVQSATMDVMNGTDGAQGPQGNPGVNGTDGIGIDSVSIDMYGHLIVTFDDGSTHDAGLIPGGTGAVDSVNGKVGIVTLYGTDILMGSAPGAKSVNTEINDLGLLLGSKVDKVPGKGLSTNDFTNDDKTALRTSIPADISALGGSLANVKMDVTQLAGSLANKVDKVVGKGLSTNDFDDAALAKLQNMLAIQSAGSGLNFNPNTGELTATGAAITIDPSLDKNSPNAIQNQAVAIPIEALQGSMSQVKLDVQQLQGSVVALRQDVDQLQGSMVGVVKDPNYVHTDNNFTDLDKAALSQLPLDVQQLHGSVVNLDLKVDQLEASMVGVVKDPNYVHTDNNYTNTDQQTLTQLPLDVQQLQGSVISLKLAVNQMSGSLMYKADKTELDEFTGTELVGADHKVTFDNLDDGLCYKLCGGDRIVRIEGNFHKENSTLYPGKIKLTFTTDAPQNTVCKLRILK